MRKEGVTVEDYANALLSHQSAAPYPVLWVPSQRNEPAAIVSEDQVEYDKSSPFYWACDAHQKLQAEIKELEKHPEAEGLLWQLFQKQKGWLVCVKTGS